MSNLDVSTLAVEVNSKGVQETADGLNRIFLEGGKADKRVQSLTDSIDKLTSTFQKNTATAKACTDTISEGLTKQAAATAATTIRVKELGDATDGVARASAGAGHGIGGITRELIVMGGELQRGNFSRFTASITVLANRANVIPALIEKIGVASVLGFGLAAGAVLLLVTRMAAGAREQEAMNAALITTGSYAGKTAQGLNDLAHQATATGGSIGDAKKAITELAASGKFSGEQISTITTAAIAMEHATGKSVDKTIKDFESLAVQLSGNSLRATREITNAVVKLDDQYHFLSTSVLSHIIELEKEGDTKAASKIATDELAKVTIERAKEMEGSLGNVSKAWKEIADAVGDALDRVNEWGKTNVDKTFKGLVQQKEAIEADMASSHSSMRKSEDMRKLAELMPILTKAQDEYIESQKKLNKAHEEAEISQKANHSLSFLSDLEAKTGKKDADELAFALKRVRGAFKELEDSKPIAGSYAAHLITPEKKAEIEAYVTALHSPHSSGRNDDPSGVNESAVIQAMKASFALEEDAYKSHLKIMDDDYKNGRMSSSMYYHELEAARDGYGKKILAAYEAESDSLANYNNRTDIEEAETNKKLQKLWQEKNKMMQDLAQNKQMDKVSQLDDEQKAYNKLLHSIESAGNAEVLRLNNALATAKLHNAEIGKTAAEKDAEKAKIEEVALAQLSADMQGIESMQIMSDMTAKEKAASDEKLVYLKREYDLKLAIMGVDVDSASKNIFDKLKKQQEEIDKSSVQGAYGLAAVKIAIANKVTETEIASYEQSAKAYVGSRLASGQITEDQADKQYAAVEANAKKMHDTLEKNNKTEFKIAGLKDAASYFASMAKSSEAFGGHLKNLTKSIGLLGSAMTSYRQQMTSIKATEAKELAATKDAEEQANIKRKAALDIQIAQTEEFGSMAAAAQGFFEAGSRGYEAMGAAAKVMHAAEEALMIVKGINAILTQGEGDPYSAFARIAAMTAIVVGLGVAVAGGGQSTGNDAASIQKTQGTGTVLGDAAAKSSSISKSLDDLKKNSDVTLPISQAMLESLQNISQAMVGLAQIIFRTTGIAAGTGMGIYQGITNVATPGWLNDSVKNVDSLLLSGSNPQTPALNNSIVQSQLNGLGNLLGKTSQSVTDSGLSIGGTMANLQNGQGINQYANIHSSTSSLFGLINSSSDQTVYAAVDKQISSQIGKIFTNMGNTLKLAASLFGLDANDVAKKIADYVVSIPKLSLQGLTGQALSDALNNAFSAVSDTMAQKIIPGFEEFQKVGEGYFQTVIRVANGMDQANSALKRLNITAVSYKDILDKQGDVATEIVRQSLIAHEQGTTGVSKILDSFTGAYTDLLALYSSLMVMRQKMRATGLNDQNLSADMISGAGGVSQFDSAIGSYQDKFFTQAEKTAATTAELTKQFSALGLTLPTSIAGFRQLVNGIDTSTAAGQFLLGQVLNLADSFSTIVPGIDQVTGSVDALATSLGLLNTDHFATLVDYTRYIGLAANAGVTSAVSERNNLLASSATMGSIAAGNQLLFGQAGGGGATPITGHATLTPIANTPMTTAPWADEIAQPLSGSITPNSLSTTPIATPAINQTQQANADLIEQLKSLFSDLNDTISSGDVAVVSQVKEILKIERKWDQNGIPETRNVTI